MAAVPQYNIVDLQYPLHRVVLNPFSYTVTVYCGFLFPRNDKMKMCAVNFGDTSDIYYLDPIEINEYESMVSAVSGYTSFFPNWGNNKVDNASVMIPTFKITYRYKKPGTYKVRCVLTDSNNNAYRGISTQITVNRFRLPANPNNESNIDDFIEGYAPTNYSGSTPLVINSNYTPVTSTELPISVTYSIDNIAKRDDIRYVYWEINNNTSVLYNTRYSNAQQLTARFPLLPRDRRFVAKAKILYLNDDNDLQVYSASNVRNIENTGNINVSREKSSIQTIEELLDEGRKIAGTEIDTRDDFSSADTMYDICAIPAVSDTLPVTTTFIVKCLPGLRLVLCDFDDGHYDVISIGEEAAAGEIFTGVRTRTFKHRYTSVNHTDFFPVFIYLFERPDGTFYSERRTLRSRLRYSVGVFEQNGNHRLLPISSSTNFRKYRNISTVVTYSSSGNTATVRARLSIGTNSKHILSFDKIIWNVNGEGIVQIKNTSLQFGCITLNVNVPYSKFTISAAVYRNSTSGTQVDEVYAFYTGDSFDILTREDNDKRNYKLKLLNQQPSLDFSLQEPEADDVIPIDLPERLTTEIETQEYLQNLSDDVQYEGTMLVFDKAITAEAPAPNFLNRNHPTIASERTKQYADNSYVGFFNPSKTSLTVVDPGQFIFYANIPAIETGRPYYFPDPYKYGSSTISLKFEIDKSSFTKGIDFSYLKNLPNATDVSTVYSGYTSNHTRNLPYISQFDNKYIADRKEDVYGNIYMLFKDGSSFKQNVSPISKDDILQYLYVNGYVFYDVFFNSGSSYNYELTGVTGDIIQSGITTQTQHLSVDNSNYAVLDFGKLSNRTAFPNNQPINIKTQYYNPLSSEEINCGTFVDEEIGAINDFMSSDLLEFPGDGNYYFTELFEAGVSRSIPYQRPLLDDTNVITQSITATFTESLFLSNTGSIMDVDCGMFYTKYNIIDDDIIHKNDSLIFEAQSITSTTEFTNNPPSSTSIVKRKQAPGELYIYDSYGVLKNILDLQFNVARYGSTIYRELSCVVNFDVLYNKIFIQTDNYFIIDNISYNAGAFSLPHSPTNTIKYNDSPFNKVSNRLKINNDVYFVITEKLNIGDTHIRSKLYKYNFSTEELLCIYPYLNTPSIEEQFFVTDDSTLFVELATPRICYNKATNKINLTFILKDQNKSPTFVSSAFKLLPDTHFSGYMVFKFGNGLTFNFSNNNTTENISILFKSL